MFQIKKHMQINIVGQTLPKLTPDPFGILQGLEEVGVLHDAFGVERVVVGPDGNHQVLVWQLELSGQEVALSPFKIDILGFQTPGQLSLLKQPVSPRRVCGVTFP